MCFAPTQQPSAWNTVASDVLQQHGIITPRGPHSFLCTSSQTHSMARLPLSLHHLPLTHHPPQQDPESETARKKAEADRLRAAEKFMVIGSGTAQCKGCGYEYSPEKGDPDFPIAKGVRFQVGVLWVRWSVCQHSIACIPV